MKCYWEWPPPSFIPTLWNIGILHHKQAKLRKDMQNRLVNKVPAALVLMTIGSKYFPN